MNRDCHICLGLHISVVSGVDGPWGRVPSRSSTTVVGRTPQRRRLRSGSVGAKEESQDYIDELNVIGFMLNTLAL